LSGDVSVDLGSGLPYLEDRIRTLFGRDADTLEWSSRLHTRLRFALEQSRSIQCIGMPDPISIEAIYQPLRLQSRRSGDTDAFELIRGKQNAIVFAGPGRGKSTLLAWLFIKLFRNDDTFPFLFILRSQDAVTDLTEFVSRLISGKGKNILKKKKPLLLIDGYDEIETEDRKAVSKALARFKSEDLGNFILTCRTFYDVYDLAAPHYELSPFSDNRQIKRSRDHNALATGLRHRSQRHHRIGRRRI
jgi:hypothetical protein